MLPTLTEVLEIAGCSRDDFNNWKRRGIFAEPLLDTEPGVAQILTKRNALELAFITPLIKTGIRPQKAALYTQSFLRSIRGSHKIREYFVYAAGEKNPKDARGLDRIHVEALQEELGTIALCIIRVGEIFRRVDRLYAEKAHVS